MSLSKRLLAQYSNRRLKHTIEHIIQEIEKKLQSNQCFGHNFFLIGKTKDERRKEKKEMIKENKKYNKKNKSENEKLKKEIHSQEDFIKNIQYDILNYDMVTEEDWCELLKYYENMYIKNLKSEYKIAYDKIKHLRNDNFLMLLDKISEESKNMRQFMNSRNDYSTQYWGSLYLRDFQIS
jgi:hypothetical protein